MRLTNKQITVLKLLSEGNKVKDIADILNLDVRTVKQHSLIIRRKLKARNTTHAVCIAFREGII